MVVFYIFIYLIGRFLLETLVSIGEIVFRAYVDSYLASLV